MRESKTPRLSEVLDGPALIDRLGESLPGLVYVFDVIETQTTYANRNLVEWLGHGEIAATATPGLIPYLHPDDIALVVAHRARVLELPDVVTMEIEYRVRDADECWHLLRAWESVLTRDLQGRPRQLLGFAQKIAPRIESGLQHSKSSHSEQSWRSIAENPFDFVVVIDRSHRYTFVNFTAPGIEVDELLGIKTPFDFISPADHAHVRAAFDVVFEEGRASAYEVYVPELDKWFSSVVGPIRTGDVVTHASILTREISEERRMQRQAREAQEQMSVMEAKFARSAKLEAVGQLAGGIAHDFNNLLTGIIGVTEALALRFAPADSAHQDIHDLREAVARGARVDSTAPDVQPPATGRPEGGRCERSAQRHRTPAATVDHGEHRTRPRDLP